MIEKECKQNKITMNITTVTRLVHTMKNMSEFIITAKSDFTRHINTTNGIPFTTLSYFYSCMEE